jgi:pimeloyl-ACP methyl ester carboxylesterase
MDMAQNLELAVHTFPGERPVLLIHGFTRSAELDWIEPGWPPALAAQGRGTIAVDLPGHGSCPAADPDAVSVNAIIAAMVATIDSAGQELADVIGYSLGARLAWTLAATGRVGLAKHPPWSGGARTEAAQERHRRVREGLAQHPAWPRSAPTKVVTAIVRAGPSSEDHLLTI